MELCDFSLLKSRNGLTTVKSKQEKFRANNNLLLPLIGCAAGLKQLIGRWCQNSNFLLVS